MDREGLWFKVLVARYMVVGGRLDEGGRDGSVWWMEVACICDGVGAGEGGWFTDNLRLKVGNGATALFWLDRWVGDVPLRDKFRRLFDL